MKIDMSKKYKARSPYDLEPLRNRIISRYGTQSKFALKIGIPDRTVSEKLNGKSRLSQLDIEEWADALEIPKEKYGKFFFTRR